jgi:23S rRNA (guanosine2251-2'-O)-methyltransferase
MEKLLIMEYIYGINPAFEVIAAGRRRIIEAYILKSNNPRLKKLLSLFEKREIGIKHVDKGQLISLSGTKKHQGVVLKVSNYPYVSFESLFSSSKLLLLDNIEDPHNLGAILRSAEVFGFHSVLLSRRGTPNVYPSVVKVSAGATEFLKITNESSANVYAKKAIDKGYTVVVLDEDGKTDIDEIKAANPEKLLVVIGGEDKSVGQFIINLADYVVAFKQYGKVNSLNASVAAGIAMFALSDNKVML